MDASNRRPLKSRGTGWAGASAAALARAGVGPDLISAASVVFAAIGAGCLVASATAGPVLRAALLVGAAAFVQLRLLCNLLDGMVAVEHGRGGPYGPIWNELPDRVSDVLLLAAMGWAAGAGGPEAPVLGWIASVLAVLTAYVRELGRASGFAPDFSGPMAKPHRMALLTGACMLSLAEPLVGWRGQVLYIALVIVVFGAALTVARRVGALGHNLKQSAAGGR